MPPTALRRVIGSGKLPLCLALAGAMAMSATPDLANQDAAQALITYGYLVEWFPDDFLLHTGPTTALTREMDTLGNALNSLGCDVTNRLAFSHDALLVVPSSDGRWVELPKPTKNSLFGWLVVIRFPQADSQRVLAVLTGQGPADTTVFSLEAGREGYVAKLLYDSFKKNKISNLNYEMIGAISGLRLESSASLLLKELVQPGSGPREQFAVGRVFRLNLSTGRMELISPGTLPRR
jgi:hypothetical protein